MILFAVVVLTMHLKTHRISSSAAESLRLRIKLVLASNGSPWNTLSMIRIEKFYPFKLRSSLLGDGTIVLLGREKHNQYD